MGSGIRVNGINVFITEGASAAGTQALMGPTEGILAGREGLLSPLMGPYVFKAL